MPGPPETFFAASVGGVSVGSRYSCHSPLTLFLNSLAELITCISLAPLFLNLLEHVEFHIFVRKKQAVLHKTALKLTL